MSEVTISNVNQFNTAELKLKGFKVYRVQTSVHPIPFYSRKDFYKVCIITGNSDIQYADKSIVTNGPYLFFGNPHIPYSSTLVSSDLVGYTCLFTEEFIVSNDRFDAILESPFFKFGGTPVFELKEEQKEFLTTIFEKMLLEQESDYEFKKDVIKNYLHIIIHEALKIVPPKNLIKQVNASSRISQFFLELLERQFPIESVEFPLKLRKPQDFAKNLSIHINHLNRSVKEITGKSTTEHISERIILETKMLLQNSSLNNAEIALALGFEHTTYFNNFFKKMTGKTPSYFRTNIV